MDSDSDLNEYEIVHRPLEPGLADTDDDDVSLEDPFNLFGHGHPPWKGHGDKLVGIVDMGRQDQHNHFLI